MSGLIVASSRPGTGGRTPTVHEFVKAYIRRMRAPLKQATMFTVAGRQTLHRDGERVLFAPDGTPLRVIERHGPGGGGNQIEHGDHLHAHVRAPCVAMRGEALGLNPAAVERARRPKQRTHINLRTS